MPVLLVLELHSPKGHYPPLKWALDRLGAKRLLKTAWLIDAPLAHVKNTLSPYMPITDGYVLAEMESMEHRPHRKL